MTAAAPPTGVSDGTVDADVVADMVEETLGCAEDGSTVVLVRSEGGRNQLYQFRRSSAVVAEAPTLRLLAERIAELS